MIKNVKSTVNTGDGPEKRAREQQGYYKYLLGIQLQNGRGESQHSISINILKIDGVEKLKLK